MKMFIISTFCLQRKEACDQNHILLLSKFGCPVSLIISVIQLEKGIDVSHISFLEKKY